MTSHRTPTEEEPGNVVPIDGTTTLAKLDPLLEEINVVRIEGRYFSFDKHEAKKKSGIYEYRDGDRGIVIETNPRYGQPSIIAYKVLQAVFRKITLEGKPYPETVAFSYHELGRMIGRDIIGGNDSRQLFTAIRQLQDTKIELNLYDAKSGKRQQFSSRRFELIITTGFIGEGQVNSPRLKAAVLTVHPLIMDSMRRGHFAIFNWTRLSQLEPVAAAMYKRLYLHLSNLHENKYSKETLKFEKLYEDICAEWLGGLKPEKYKSRILQQLGRYLDALQETGLIRSVTIEKTADEKGFKMVFKPGKAFFYDYEHFYRKDGKKRLLQFQEAADWAHLKAPYTAVRLFYKHALRCDDRTLDEMVFPEKDITFARQMIDQFGEDGVRDLITFALGEAPKTNFQMQSIAAVKTYLPAWQADRESHAKRLAAQQQEDAKRRREKLEQEYESFKRHAAIGYFEKCSPEEREEIHRLTGEKIATDYLPNHPMRKLVFNATERSIILERCTIPDFESWLASRT